MKNFTQVVNEGWFDSKPFSVFGLLFGSSHDKDDEVSRAKKKAREDMAKKKDQAKEDLKKKKKSIKAKLIEAKANFKMNQFNIKQKQKVDALERRLRQMTKLASMYDRNSSDGILHDKNGFEAYQKMLNNVKNGLPEDHIDDAEYMQAKITKCLFKKDDDGNIIESSPDEIQTSLNELVGTNGDPKIKDIMKKHSLMDENGNIKGIDEETRKQLLSDFAGYSSDYENADKDLEKAETIHNELKIKKEKLEEAEATREKLDKISKSFEKYNSIPNEAEDITETVIPGEDGEDGGAPKEWDKLTSDEIDGLKKQGITKEIYKSAYDESNTRNALVEKLNTEDAKEKRTAELAKQKNTLKNEIESAASEAGLSLDSGDMDDENEIKGKISEKGEAINQTLEDAGIPKDTSIETIKTALTDAEKNVKACREKIEEKNEQLSQLRATYEAAEEVEKKHGVQNNEDVKKIKDEVEKESWNGGEVEQSGKKGVEYIDKNGDKQFMSRPEPGSKDEKLYQQRLKLAVLQQQEDLSQPLEVVEPDIDKDGKLTNEKEYKEYLQAKAKREAAESQMEKIRTEIQTAAKNAKDGKEITSEQKELIQATVNSFPDDHSKLTADQQAMLASFSMVPPKDPKADDKVKVGEEEKVWKDLDDEEKETYRKQLRDEEEKKHKESLQKLGLNDDQIKKAQKLSKKEETTSTSKDTTTNDSEDDIDFENDADHDEEDKEEDDNEYDDGDGNKLKNPSKIWHRKKKKNGNGMTKSYYNGEKDNNGNPISISREEFKEKLKAYRDAKQRQNNQSSTSNESLSTYLQKKLLLG